MYVKNEMQQLPKDAAQVCQVHGDAVVARIDS
jgi:hypothetical protein